MGTVLYQKTATQEWHIISYASAKFSKTEQSYIIKEQECLAVVWAIKRYRLYLEDRLFLLHTDNRSLVWLSKMKDAKSKLSLMVAPLTRIYLHHGTLSRTTQPTPQGP